MPATKSATSNTVTATTFKAFAKAVHEQYTRLAQGELYVTSISKDELWQLYLSSFPEGSNPIYRERTEHDCQCCRNFIVNLGRVVGLRDSGEPVTVWDDLGVTGPYAVVAESLSAFLKLAPISGLFRSKEISYGSEHTWQLHQDGTKTQWQHFHGRVATRHYSKTPDACCGTAATTVDVYKRGLIGLSFEALDATIGLIEQEALYRGPEFLGQLRAFRRLKEQYTELGNLSSSLPCNWMLWRTYKEPAARFKNTVIGTLVEDLSNGVDLEKAVGMFESKVAPTNYKRPKSLITPKMINDAVAKVEELGLSQALSRRFAKLSDVSINNVLFVDGAVKSQLRDCPLTDLLMEEARRPVVKLDGATPIGVDDFMSTVLPTAKSIFAQVTGDMLGNFVSLTAPAVENSGKLLRWNNDFAWSYDGNITDSIKQRVKRAGGRVDAKLRVSLSWFNLDDLDIHVTEPSGNTICYYNKGGKLDVDMNVTNPVRDAVENVSWTEDNLADGNYKVFVDNYFRRESVDVGFMLQMEFNGELHTFRHDRAVKDRVAALSFRVQSGKVTEIKASSGIERSVEFRDKWGIEIGALSRVDSIMLSPNYWDENRVGNKHWFFLLQGCKNPEPTRGIYNEFLNPALEPHRKVFEILGDKMKCPVADAQLSGVGFSSTLEHELPVVVQHSRGSRAYKIKF